MKRIANVLNDRPVSAQRTNSASPDEDLLVPLTPNMLITGRSQAGPPSDYVDVVDVHTQRSFLQELEAAWWYQYKVQCFESLAPTRKWIGLVRTCCVQYHLCKGGAKPDYVRKEVRVPTQRLVLILPIEDQDS